jgi:hypothetical protein
MLVMTNDLEKQDDLLKLATEHKGHIYCLGSAFFCIDEFACCVLTLAQWGSTQTPSSE